MTSDKVTTNDEAPRATLNAARIPRGTYKVVAPGGISVSIGDREIDAKKGDEIELEGDAVIALMNDGAIKQV